MARKKRSKLPLLLGVLLGAAMGATLWLRKELAPLPPGPSKLIHLDRTVPIVGILRQLKAMQVVRSVGALRIYGWLHRSSVNVRPGTYSVHSGMNADEILHALSSPLHQKFRFPETNWARRSANLLQKAQVASAVDYLFDVAHPERFKNEVSFPLPKHTLEGYLFPDTYDLPPLTGAKAVVDRQLRTFQSKVVDKLGPVAASPTVVTKASLVELETGTDEDRKMIAGVIDNRLKKGMPLQIDAGILYALGKWRRLYFKDYKNVKSPYNMYLHKGLPPTPICSPSLKSIVAALHPAKHPFIYYVAMPDGHSLFAKTPAEHEHNIRLRKIALKERRKQTAALDTLLGHSARPGASR